LKGPGGACVRRSTTLCRGTGAPPFCAPRLCHGTMASQACVQIGPTRWSRGGLQENLSGVGGRRVTKHVNVRTGVFLGLVTPSTGAEPQHVPYLWTLECNENRLEDVQLMTQISSRDGASIALAFRRILSLSQV